MSLSLSIIGHFSLFLEHPIFNSSSTFLCEYTKYIFCFEGNVLPFLNVAVRVLTASSLRLWAPSAFPSPSCMAVVWLLKWAQSYHTTLEFLCWKKGVSLGDSNFCLLLRKRSIFTYCGCIYYFVMLCAPLELLVFCMRSFGRVKKSDRLGEHNLALLSFVSCHFFCSLVFSFLGVYSVLSCY